MAWNAPATRSGLDFTERNDTPPPPKLLYIMAFFRTFTTLFLMAYGPEFSGQERVDGRQQKKRGFPQQLFGCPSEAALIISVIPGIQKREARG